MSEREQDVHVHCLIPLESSDIIGVPEFQREYRAAKNSRQHLRVALRVLSKQGFLSGMYQEKWVKEILEDYEG